MHIFNIIEIEPCSTRSWRTCLQNEIKVQLSTKNMNESKIPNNLLQTPFVGSLSCFICN